MATFYLEAYMQSLLSIRTYNEYLNFLGDSKNLA